MTELEQAVDVLKKNYERAKTLEFVRNPIAWALYKTWRYFDAKSKKERGNKNACDYF